MAEAAVSAMPQAALPGARHPSALVGVLVRLNRSPTGRLGLVLLVLLMGMAIAAPLLAPYDPLLQHPGQELQPPSPTFPLGTDELGRDLLSRILYGARTAFMVALIAVGTSTVIGTATGLLAGYFGGAVDAVLMRVYDMILTFPGILIGIAVVSVLGPGSVNVAWALAIGLIPTKARLLRSSVLSEREREYVLAARGCGASDWRIMWLHILPNSLSPLIVNVFLSLGFTVLAEASLSFLGLGTQPPEPSWGGMLNQARAFLRVAPWYGIWPGLALALLVYALNSVADALRDALDPRRVNLM